ncbi:MAG: Yip1 family protein [Candidatus Odinarchaeota archaeon]
MSSEDSVVCPNHGCGERVPKDYVLCPYCGYNLLAVLKEATKVKITIRESIGRIRKLVPVRNPMLLKDKTLECMGEVATNADRKGPIIVLFLLSAAYSLKLAPYVGAINNASGGPVAVSPQFVFLLFYIFIPLLIGLFLLPVNYLIWRVLAILVHFPSKYMGGGGSQVETQSVIGYALTPLIIGELVINTVLYFIIGNSTSATTLYENMVLFEAILIIPFFVWAAAIAMIGLMEVHNLKYPIAGGIAGGIAGIYIILFVPPYAAILSPLIEPLIPLLRIIFPSLFPETVIFTSLIASLIS